MATPLCSSFVVTVHQEVLNSWPKYETNYALHSCFFISLFLFLVPPLSFMKNTKMGQWSLKDVNDCKSDSPKNQTHPICGKFDMVNPSKNQKKDGRITPLGGLQSLHGFSSNISSLAPTKHTQNNKKDKVYKLLIGRSNLFAS